jgi:uncharacterized RDD family membrane protein YckC
MADEQFQGQYAGFVSRFIALTLDMIIITVIGFVVTAFIGLLISFFGLDETAGNPGLSRVLNILQQIVLLAGAVFTSLFGMAYFLFFWVVAGFTPGKGLMGLRVVRADGRPVTIGPAFLRYVGYWISGLFLFLGYVWVIFDGRRQGWHDKLGGTVVIYDWPSSGSARKN